MKLAFEILQGLVYLNKHGVSHRNLKLENILFDPEVRTQEHQKYYYGSLICVAKEEFYGLNLGDIFAHIV